MKRLQLLSVAAVLTLAAGAGLWAAVPVGEVVPGSSVQAGQPAPPVPAPPAPPAPPEDPERRVERIYTTGIEGLGLAGSRIGARVREVTKDDVGTMKLDGLAGAVVEEITSESAAAKAGVKEGDVIVGFDGERVRSATQLTRLVRETPAGRTVKIDVVRGGSRTSLDITPQAPEPMMGMRPFIWRGQGPNGPAPGMRMRVMPEIPEVPEVEIPEFDMPENFAFMVAPGRARLGVGVSDLTPELATHFGAKSGVIVNSVSEGSPAEKSGVKVGDVITAVGDTTIENAAELRRELARTDKGEGKTADVTVGIVRDKKPMNVKVTIERPETPRKRTVVRQRIRV